MPPEHDHDHEESDAAIAGGFYVCNSCGMGGQYTGSPPSRCPDCGSSNITVNPAASSKKCRRCLKSSTTSNSTCPTCGYSYSSSTPTVPITMVINKDGDATNSTAYVPYTCSSSTSATLKFTSWTPPHYTGYGCYSYFLNDSNAWQDKSISASNWVASSSGYSIYTIYAYYAYASYDVTLSANGGTHVSPSVTNISTSYGFALNSSTGYYTSNNKAVTSSYALCKLSFTTPANGNLALEVINYAEANYDFGIFSNIDTTLSSDNTADTSNVYKSFKGLSQAAPQYLTYSNISAGSHYIYIKYRKDGSADSNNDNLQFRVLTSTAYAVTYNTLMPTVTIPSRAGYTFAGYYSSSSGTGTKFINADGTPANAYNLEGSTIYAYWLPNGIPVSFTTNGGTLSDIKSTSWYTIGRNYMYSKLFTINVWAYMSNWSTISSNTQQIISCTQNGGFGIGYYASTKGHGFEAYITGKGYYGTDMGLPNLSSGWHMLTGTFDGRYLKAYVDGKLTDTTDIGSSGNTVLYNSTNTIFVGAEAGDSPTSPEGMQFTGSIKSLQIWNSAYDASTIDTISRVTVNNKWVTYGSTYGTLPTPTRTGYTFAGWYKESSFTNQVTTTSTVSTVGNHTLYAKWTGKTYSVYFDTNKGSGSTTPTAGSTSVTATYGSAMPSATMPTRAGYTFQGYYDTSAVTGGTQYYTASGASARAWNKTASTTLYARWTPNKYRISFNENVLGINTNLFSVSDFSTKYGTVTIGTDLNPNVTCDAGSGNTFSNFKIQKWNNSTYVSQNSISSTGSLSFTFTKETGTKLRIGMNGSTQDAVVDIEISHLPNGTYTASANLTSYSSSRGVFSSIKIESGSVRTSYSAPTQLATFDSDMPSTGRWLNKNGYLFQGYYDTSAATGGTQYYTNGPSSTRKWTNTSSLTLYSRWQEKTWSEGYYATSYGGGDGTQSNPYIISTAAHLARLAYATNNNIQTTSGRYDKNAYYKQTADIDINAHEWEPIGGNNAFAGSYDGNQYIISNLRLTIGYGGLFRNLSGSTIKGINIKSATIHTPNSHAFQEGILAGNATGALIEKCVIEDISAEANAPVGGIVGWASSTTIRNCRVDAGNMQGYYTGGIVGGATGSVSVENCSVYNVNLNSSTSGVIIGYQTGSNNIISSYGNGTINGTQTKVMYGNSTAWGNWSLIPNVNGGLPIQKGLYHSGGFSTSQDVYNYLTKQGYTVQS